MTSVIYYIQANLSLAIRIGPPKIGHERDLQKEGRYLQIVACLAKPFER